MSDPRATWLSAALGVSLVAATAYPGFLDPHDDGYPLSTYPMFSRDRGRELKIASARLRFPDGSEEALPPALVANGEVMQAIQRLNHAMRRGRRTRRRLCRDIAARVTQAGTQRQRDASEVLLVQARVDTVAFLGARSDASDADQGTQATNVAGRRVRARCKLPERP